MSNLEKAEHLVRNHPANKELMELGFGCEVRLNKTHDIFLEQYYTNRFEGGEQLAYKFADLGVLPANKVRPGPEILGKPSHLEHYLRVLGEVSGLDYANQGTYFGVYDIKDDTELLCFNLTTGKPATEKDAEEFIRLVDEIKKEEGRV